jgi:hypothetical protein
LKISELGKVEESFSETTDSFFPNQRLSAIQGQIGGVDYLKGRDLQKRNSQIIPVDNYAYKELALYN